MIVIAGLGNPGKEYEHTRHNVGFDLIDVLAERYQIGVNESKFQGLYGKGIIEGEKVILVKPLTYMNLSGICIQEVLHYFKCDPKTDLIVISDDISLPEGMIRIRKKGSAGGHNGLKNIIAQVGTDEFARIRIGVGDKPKNGDLVNHVLGHFTKEARAQVEQGLENAADAIALAVRENMDAAMNQFNKKKSDD
ncbi:MAG: aminoacyl-tRNA hydrolase [Lachnospiraceae bacterium]|jgi:PTH1 family peptidyl-tRNA hydrolase|nr:aminoacyl-tRNA hydrolase [Lachnospiraceae bacterium]